MKTNDVPTHSKSWRIPILVAIGVVLAVGVVVAARGGKSSPYAMSATADQPRSVATQPAKPATTVSLATNAAIGQQVLVDSNGMTLYLFVPDGTATQSTVPAQFKPNWPPVTAVGAPTAGPGIDMTKLEVHAQSDGTPQVSYNGHLLYTYINDKAPGDANGQGLGPNNWFVLDANGNPIAAPAKPTVSLSQNAKIGQQVLVDSKGMTLYLFVPDGMATQSTVPAQFKPNWPQLTATGAPTAGRGVDMTKLAVHKQSDGTPQVSYNGHLLYTFINDTAPGDANGQGLGPNNWFVLDANGNPIGAPKAASTSHVMPKSTSGGW